MLERLICAVFGHRYVVERVLNLGARKVGCTRCNSHWAMHDGTRSFVRWDGEFEEFYAPGGILAQASGDVPPNVEFSGGAPLHGAASAGTQGYASEDQK